ncbi:hypothetical protein KUCAC02_001670 [Chaenocephalus aceratus]|uniref:Uncharacterized protein n=1 Tax=Chaenocephalus aceratus TaxID=36190 RepID=A0ACB9XTV6_CHAAC|nr:hypothetical protein KUCAC02_001670 [Chaenocephalus aceratus]
MCSCVRSSRALSPVLRPARLLPQTGYRLASRGLWTSPPSLAVGGDSTLLPLPSQARVVICGGGIVGSSVAFHLAKLGWTDIVLLEQGRLGAGTTRLCAGIVSVAKPISIECQMANYSNGLYKGLEEETGTGSLCLAQNQDRFLSLKRLASRLKVMGISCNVIKPKEVAKLHPHVNIHDLVGALHLPGDAVVSPPDINHALAVAAAAHGVQILERTTVQQVLVEKGQVTAGWRRIEAPSSVNSLSTVLDSGRTSWGQASEMKDPLPPDTPVLMDMDGRIYARALAGRRPKPAGDPEHAGGLGPLRADAQCVLRRMPSLQSAEIHQLVNCPESFTPDMRCLMGETPGISGYFVLAGMNSSGLAFAGGAGKYLAEWMTYGYPTANVWPLDIKRFGNLQSSRTFLRHRVMEVMRELAVSCGRVLLYDRLDTQGARWMEKHGFERTKYFVPHGKTCCLWIRVKPSTSPTGSTSSDRK